MKTSISIFLFVLIPLITFSQNEEYHRPYEVAISNLNGKHIIADSLKLILHSTTDSSIICLPEFQYLDYINNRSITLQEIPFNQIELIYFNKSGNTLGRTLLISTAIGTTVGFILGNLASKEFTDSYPPFTPENALLYATISLALEGFFVGGIIWIVRHHVNVNYANTISEKNQDKINKFVLKNVE